MQRRIEEREWGFSSVMFRHCYVAQNVMIGRERRVPRLNDEMGIWKSHHLSMQRFLTWGK